MKRIAGWFTDWRNLLALGVTMVGIILVLTFVDSITARNNAERRADRTVAALQQEVDLVSQAGYLYSRRIDQLMAHTNQLEQQIHALQEQLRREGFEPVVERPAPLPPNEINPLPPLPGPRANGNGTNG